MARRLLSFFLLLFLSLCSDREVLLPVIAADGISETQNHSSIWIFYDPSGQESKAVMNKNNKLLNTNWIFNIDRRLTMKDVIPLLEEMQLNRNKDSMHKKEGMVNFFSYADSKNERISLVPFPEISFRSVDEASSLPVKDPDSCLVRVQILEDSLLVDGIPCQSDQIAQIRTDEGDCENAQAVLFRLEYHEDLSYQRFLETRALFSAAQLPVDTIELVDSLK